MTEFLRFHIDLWFGESERSWFDCYHVFILADRHGDENVTIAGYGKRSR
jgi:hypothetical protein